jgi:photosystem II stability/assembly factor-like uncharacterized protein
MTEFIERYEGNLFIQQDPADVYAFLTCTGVGNITIPKGTRTLKYKQDLRRSGRIKAAGAITSAADFTTASITRPLESVNNYLHEIVCPFNARINWACRGTRPLLTNYELGALLYDAAFTTGTIETPLAGEGDNDRINTTGDLSATLFTYVYPLDGETLTLTSTTDIYALAVVPSECASKCGHKVGLGEIVWAGLEYTAYTIGYILVNKNYGAGGSWVNPGWWPFSVGGDISSIVIVDGQNGYRVICARGSAGAGPAEISYSDDEGVTGTDVVVGAVNGQTIQMLRKDWRGRVWAAASAGDIYVSSNNGVTWTETGSSATAQDLYDIVFFDENKGYAVGDNNAFVYTTNGGTTWTAGTGPSAGDNLLSMDVNYAGHIYAANDDAELWRSTDEGDTWELMLNLAGSIDQVRFDEDFRYFGYLVNDDATPIGTLYRSEDAGNTWVQVGVPATDYDNAGLNCVAICDPNMLYVGGAPHGGVSFAAKFERAS